MKTPEVKWLVERAAFDDDNPVKMRRAVETLDMQCVEARYVPLGGGCINFHDRTPINLGGDLVIFYGSINLCRWLMRSKPWQPLAWADFEGALRCRHYYAHWGRHLLSAEYAMMPVAEVVRRRDWVWKTFADEDGHVFVRPDDNAKSFAGELVHADKVDEWHGIANLYSPSDEAMAVVARPSKIVAEWRLVVRRKSVIAGSRYRLNGMAEIEEGYPPEAAAFAESVTRGGDFEPAPLYCIDVCRTAGGEYRLVEVGAVNTCGLYAADIEAVVIAATEIAVEEWTALNA